MKKEKFGLSELAVVIFLLFFSNIVLSSTGFFKIRNLEDLYNYNLKHIFEGVICAFFIAFAIYIIIYTIRSLLFPYQKDILYLFDINNKNECIFVDCKGNNIYFNDGNKYIIGKNYIVLMKDNNICKVLNMTKKSLKKDKENYWMNFYTMGEKFENLLILPILFAPLIIGLFAFFASQNIFSRIIAFLFFIFPSVSMLLYDLICKIKNNQKNLSNDNSSNQLEFDNIKLKSIFRLVFNILKNIILLLAILAINVFLFWLLIKSADKITRIVISIFFCCGICFLGNTIGMILKNEKMRKIFRKAFIIVFLVYWFGLLTYSAINYIKIPEERIMIVITIPFWIAGIYIFYKEIIKK